MNRDAFLQDCQTIGLTLTPEQVDAFEAFEEALYGTNAEMNLTRVAREECATRHFVDSLLFHDLIPEGATLLDIGCGPGFPCWPIACARPDLQVTALDSSGKMLSFLRSQPLPNLTIVQERAEEWGVRNKFDVVTGRAVAPLAAQLEISAPPMKRDGLLIPMRTPSDDVKAVDWEALGLQPCGLQKRALPGTDIVRVFPLFKKIGATPARYPRRWAEIRKKPLTKPR